MHFSTKKGFAPAIAIIIALLVIGGGSYGIKKFSDKKTKKEVPPVTTGMPVPGTDTKETEVFEKVTTLQVRLDEQNTSGESGQAVLTQIGTSTVKVVINLTGKPSTVAQPAHIHIGACPTPGAVKYPLTNVDKGASQTEIPNMTLEQLLAELPLAVNVHKSATDVKTYVACGNIVKEETKSEMKEESAVKQSEMKVVYNTQGFSPESITVKKGETVVFENKTGKRASVASNDHPTHLLYPEFDQYKTDARGKDEFRFTFEKVGTWGYHDHLNASVRGTVIVTE